MSSKWLDIDYFRELVDTLTRNKSRTILTGFGIFWGMFMLLAMSGGADGLKQMLSRNFEGFATNAALFIPGATSKPYAGFQKGRTWNMDTDDIQAIRSQVSGLSTVAPICVGWQTKAVRGENSYSSGAIKGLTREYYQIETPKMKYGRMLNDMDEHNSSKVCVIGKRVYENLFPEGGDPCGKRIDVDGVSYLVVGMDINAGNMSIGASADNTISVPLSLFRTLYGRGKRVDLIGITAHSGVSVKEIQTKTRHVLARRHSIDPEDEVGIMSVNTEAIFRMMDNLMRGVDILILLVGLGTVLAGAIGVSNIMMVTVKERTTEIGIRRAIGATPKMILGQIIGESILLTSGSGLLGVVFSVGVLAVAELAATDTSFQISFYLAIAALAGLALLGVLAGLAPALRAMKIKPVDAMRDE